jgi:hypothetical protein
MKARETVSVDPFISQVLWWYVNGIQLAKVELLIDRTITNIKYMITFVSGIMNRHVVCTMVKIITAHPVYVRNNKQTCSMYYGRFFFFFFLIFCIIDETHVYIWNSTCNQSLHNTVIIRATKLCFLTYIDVITLFGCSVLETRIKLYWYVLFLDQCHKYLKLHHISKNSSWRIFFLAGRCPPWTTRPCA